MAAFTESWQLHHNNLHAIVVGTCVPRHRRWQAARRLHCAAVQALHAVAAPPGLKAELRHAEGHSALLQGLGEVGDVPTVHVPWLLRLAHIRSQTGGDSNTALKESSRGLIIWQMALERGLLPDDETLKQLTEEPDSLVAGRDPSSLRWPAEPLRMVLIRSLSTLGVSRFAKKYPAVLTALLKSLLELICKYERAVAGFAEAAEEREKDAHGNVFLTIDELIQRDQERRSVRSGAPTEQKQAVQLEEEEEAEEGKERQAWPVERREAERLVAGLMELWGPPIETLSRAGRAFEGLESLLGGGRSGTFDLQGNMWRRKGWAAMDTLRERLEDLKELRDLVRSLGRGGGWGPLRRAPVQHLDLRGRPGLLRTVLEAQETRGLTRSDDISRLLPSEAALLARGREVRPAKLLFYAKMAEKALQIYERDGWGEFPTVINPERREIRPTADRGPILLCVDTSGSMRGPREIVAKALALECMRAAREQERGCFVFAFSGPQEVQELELGTDIKSVNNLLSFLEKVFNGGSDFNEPVKRCLDRLTNAKWANSDILLVSDGELRQPGQEIMRKLSGAKDKLGLRVHGLIVGSPELKKADPAVLRSLCSAILPNGRTEVLVTNFEGWGSVKARDDMQFDWDDAMGNARRRAASLAQEALRKGESARRRKDAKAAGKPPPPRAKKDGKPEARKAIKLKSY